MDLEPAELLLIKMNIDNSDDADDDLWSALFDRIKELEMVVHHLAIENEALRNTLTDYHELEFRRACLDKAKTKD